MQRLGCELGHCGTRSHKLIHSRPDTRTNLLAAGSDKNYVLHDTEMRCICFEETSDIMLEACTANKQRTCPLCHITPIFWHKFARISIFAVRGLLVDEHQGCPLGVNVSVSLVHVVLRNVIGVEHRARRQANGRDRERCAHRIMRERYQ